MENKAHALAAGIFVLALTALVLALAFWLTREGGARQPYAIVTSQTVTGLQTQAPVRFKGVLVGQVSAIGFDAAQPGQVLIRLALDPAAPITESTYATLSYQGVTGLAFVQLDDSGESSQRLLAAPGQVPRIALRPGLVTRLAEQSGQVLDEMGQAAARLNQLLARHNQEALQTSVASAGQAAQSLRQLSARLDLLLQAQLDPRNLNLPQLAQDARASFLSLQAASEQTRQVAHALAAPGGAMEQLSQGGAALAHSAHTLSAHTLPRLHHLSEQASASLRQIEYSASQLSQNPQALLYGHGAVAPGPGEPGFTAPTVAP